jgi:site-specific DNA-methyltransferase (adenine-specific)
VKPYYEHGGIVIYHGDALDVLPSLSGVDAVVSDPPYFLPAQHYCTRKTFPRSLCDLSMLEHFLRDWFALCASALKSTGVFYVFCDGQSYPVFFPLIYQHVRRVVPLVWDKQVSFNGYSWRHQHELILFAEMDKAPSVKTGDGDILKCRAVAVGDREHPAEKPVELLARLIEKSTNRGDLVLDSFVGSGATLIAAAKLGRRGIGIDREERYCEIAAKRLQQEVLPLTVEPEQIQVGLPMEAA